MFKPLVLSCMLVICLAEPFGLPSWLREEGRRRRHPRGCVDRAEGWRACALLNHTDTLAPHGYDCSLFFYCKRDGARPACRKCPAGLHFNPQLQVCDWPDNVNCTPRPPRPSISPSPLPTYTTSYPTTTEDYSSVTYSESPATATTDYTYSEPPATATTDYTYSEPPATATTDYTYSEPPATATTDYTYSEPPATATTDYTNSEAPATGRTDYITSEATAEATTYN